MNMDAFRRTVVMAAEGAGVGLSFPRSKRLVKKTKTEPVAPPVAKQRTRSLPDWRINKNNPDFTPPSSVYDALRYQRWYCLQRRIKQKITDLAVYDIETFYVREEIGAGWSKRGKKLV